MNDGKKTFGVISIVLGAVVLFFGLIFGGIFAIVGGVFNSEGKIAEDRFEYFEDDAIKTKGKVVSSYDSTTVVSYEDEDGEIYEIYFNSSSSDYKSGTKVDVYYDEDNPEIAMVPAIEIDMMRMVGKVFSTIGIVALIVTSVIFVIGLILGIVLISKSKKENVYASNGPYNGYNNGMMR